jgi:hypothetical protein
MLTHRLSYRYLHKMNFIFVIYQAVKNQCKQVLFCSVYHFFSMFMASLIFRSSHFLSFFKIWVASSAIFHYYSRDWRLYLLYWINSLQECRVNKSHSIETKINPNEFFRSQFFVLRNHHAIPYRVLPNNLRFSIPGRISLFRMLFGIFQ